MIRNGQVVLTMGKNVAQTKSNITFVVTARITANTFVMKFAEFVAINGHSVTVIADGLEKSSKAVGLGELHTIPVGMKRDPSLLSDLKSLIVIFNEIRRTKPDVITYATPKASLLAAVASFALRIPKRIYQIWGLRLETTHGVQLKVLSLLEKLTSTLSSKVLANSESLSMRYSDMGLSPFREIDVIGKGSSHGVDLQHFSNDSEIPELDNRTREFLRKSNDIFCIGFVGRLHPDKGIDSLVEAFKIIKEKGAAACLLLVGDEEGANIPAYLIEGQDYLKVGQVSDVRPYYAEMDILTLPSLREGFPNVVLEAAAMGLPAIVSDGTGVVDSVEQGETGIIIPVGDSKALAEAFLKLMKNESLKKEMGIAARLRVEKYFPQEQVWDQTLRYLLSE